MRKTKTLENIGGKPVTVYEVRPRDILDWIGDEKSIKDIEKGKDLLAQCCTLTVDEIIDLYPSESEQVWQAFEEVNAAFFALLRATGVLDEIKDLIRIVASEFKEQFVKQYRLGMLTQQITDGSSS
ncbi:MAG: hypothetical protein AB7E32_16040 [Desulfovibrio sp.]